MIVLAYLRGAYAIIDSPAPRDIFYKGTANYRAHDAANGPGTEDHGEELRSLSQGYDVAEDHLGGGNDTAATNTLDRATSEQNSKVMGDRTQDGANGELCMVCQVRSTKVTDIRTNAKDSRSICCRPKFEEIEAITGWKTAEVRRLPASSARFARLIRILTMQYLPRKLPLKFRSGSVLFPFHRQ